MTDTSSDKIALRQRLRSVLASLTPEERHVRSLAASSRLLSTPEFTNARVIMLYLSMNQEIDTASIALKAWQEGKQIVVPKIFWSDRTMLPIEIHSLHTPMKMDPRGVREPLAGQPIPLEFIDLVLVPGLGFGPRGQRVGRGGGFYDRFLGQSSFQGVTCGVAFECQVLDDLPMLPHDVALDMLVTDQAVRRFTEPQTCHGPDESAADR
jgi:5-formyltetrahydrofolate cyclo-ligase